ncbi:unnamed protein product [Lactuca virosa]|uniref:Uncharacterized protein n=1 Tax=Lactuca virosa TaxID=75947 RepID=A0AAU9PM42_9ASTR|nr:unnamed protein product [Lactuca virosa]
MDELGPERSDHMSFHQAPPYSSSEDWWKTYETSISLGFLATAVFISMFIIMAIIEHLYKLNASFDLTRYTSHQSNDPRPVHKLVDPQPHVQERNATDLSILMPGEKYPTYIAHPTPLPCTREGVYWPSHCVHDFSNP